MELNDPDITKCRDHSTPLHSITPWRPQSLTSVFHHHNFKMLRSWLANSGPCVKKKYNKKKEERRGGGEGGWGNDDDEDDEGCGGGSGGGGGSPGYTLLLLHTWAGFFVTCTL